MAKLSTWLAIVMLCVVAASAASAAEAVVRPTSAGPLAIGRDLAVLNDPTGTLSLADVTTGPAREQFVAAATDWPTYGIAKGAAWTRVRIDLSQDPARASRRIQFSAIHPDAAEFYVVGDDGALLRSFRGGLDEPHSVTYRKFSMPLGDLAATQFTLYARLTTHHVSTLVQVLITAEDETHAEVILERVLGPLFGATFMALIYCLLLWVYLREAVYGYGFAFITNIFIAAQPYMNVDRLVWPDVLLDPEVTRAIYFGSIGLIPALGLLFTTHFLEVARWRPRLHRANTRAATVIAFAHLVVIMITPYAFMPVTTASLVGAAILVLVTVVAAHRAQIKTSITFMMIGVPVLTSLLLTNFASYGMMLQHPIWTAATVMGLTFLSAGVTIALADGFRRNLESKVQERTQELSAANTALQDAHKQKNRMLGVVAHDLRNPLTGMRAAAQLILEIPLDEARRESLLRTIRDGADVSLGMTEDLLDVAAIEEGIVELAPASIDLATLVQSRADLFRMMAQSKGVEVRVVGTAMPPVWADAKRVGQALDNLVSNAVKFSRMNGRVTIELGAVDGRARLSVTDEGVGIPAGELDLIFMPFRRASTLPTGGERSTGLGLAIVKRLVEAQGGQVGVHSTLGQGSRFDIYLPFATLAAPMAEQRRTNPNPSLDVGLARPLRA